MDNACNRSTHQSLLHIIFRGRSQVMILECSTIAEPILELEALKVIECAVEVTDLFFCSGYLGSCEGGFDACIWRGYHGCSTCVVDENIY